MVYTELSALAPGYLLCCHPLQAEERVLTFLQQQNRPYNAQGVTDHLAQFGVKKAQAQKALDALSESGKINCKVSEGYQAPLRVPGPSTHAGPKHMQDGAF